VKALLANDDRFTETNANPIIDVLQNRGYICYLDDCVRIIPDNR
jgi:hypothetical protein